MLVFMTIYNCKLCDDHGLQGVYERKYKPHEFLEGSRDSSVWIVGLNPKFDEKDKSVKHKVKTKRRKDLEYLFDPVHEDYLLHSKDTYFKNFKKVSERLYRNLGRKNGVLSTDIVKCGSNSFTAYSMLNPFYFHETFKVEIEPEKKSKEYAIKEDKIIDEIRKNCSKHFKKQLKLSKIKPKIIIGNGKKTWKTIWEALHEGGFYKSFKQIEKEAWYIANYDDGINQYEIVVFQTTFIGRKSDKDKQTLGFVINHYLDLFNICP